MMRKLFFIFTTTIFLFIQPSTVETSTELATITNVALGEGFLLDEWQVVMIEKITEKEFDNITKRLQNSYLDTVVKDENKIKYIFEAKNSKDQINHYFQAIVPTGHANQITFQLVISGEEWNEVIHNYYNNLTNELQNELSLTFSKIFTCVKLNDNGIINDGFSDDEIWKKMKVIHRNEQIDNVEQSVYEKEVYGYNKLWNRTIIVENETVNFHMGIKNNDHNKKQVIIGTPIILNEY